MSDEIPKKVRELMDLHGPGIPHISSDGKYTVEVYPHPRAKDDRFGNMAGSIEKKHVQVWDTKTGRSWGRWVD